MNIGTFIWISYSAPTASLLWMSFFLKCTCLKAFQCLLFAAWTCSPWKSSRQRLLGRGTSIKVKVICVKLGVALIYQDLRVCHHVNLPLPVCSKPHQYHPHIVWNPLCCFSPRSQISVLIPQKNELSLSDKCKLPFLGSLLFSWRTISRWWKTPHRFPVSHHSKVMTWFWSLCFCFSALFFFF